MQLKSIHVTVPNSKPFDRADWFENFVGHFVLPILATKLVESYWFTRYQDKSGRHARFRIRLADYAPLQPTVADLVRNLQLGDVGDEQNYGEEFRGRRWCGERTPAVDPAVRQQLVWNFLTASAALYVDTFSHVDNDGYWCREENRERENNIDGETMESIHHLFCNMTAVRPRVELMERITPEGFQAQILIAGTYRRWSGLPEEIVRTSQRVNF